MFEIRRVLTSDDLSKLDPLVQEQFGLEGRITRGEDGCHSAASPKGLVATIREHGGGRGRIFNRRAFKIPSDRPIYSVDVLVMELDGVRVYIDDDTGTIIMTKEDLQL